MDQIKAKENADSKLDVPRKHVSVADVRRSLNIEKKVWRNINNISSALQIALFTGSHCKSCVLCLVSHVYSRGSHVVVTCSHVLLGYTALYTTSTTVM